LITDDLVVETLFGDDTFRVDHIRVRGRTADALAYTFTEFGNRTLDGPGYGGELLLKSGYDLLSFKRLTEDWYQDVASELFEWIRLRIQRFGYRRRVAYGSSMGAHAALLFSKLLDPDILLALAPQAAIDEDFDTRWADYARSIVIQRRLTPEVLSARARYVIVADRRDEDWHHVERICAMMPAGRIHVVPLSHAGHPVTPYLYECGVLKELVLTTLAGSLPDARTLRRDARKSVNYLGNLAIHAAQRKHLNWAIRILEYARLRFEDRHDFHRLRTVLYRVLNDSAGAVESAREGLARFPAYPELMGLLAESLLDQGKPQEALPWLERALECEPDHALFRERQRAILQLLSQPP
jgi:tetratricopeptide (TPR) repeat protein